MSNEVFCYVDKKAIRLPITIEQVLTDWQISAVDIKPELSIKKIGWTIEQNCGDNPENETPFETPFWAIFTDSFNQAYIDLVLAVNYITVPYSEFNWDDDRPSRSKTKSEYLSDKEKEVFAPYFYKLGIKCNIDKLRKINCNWWCQCKEPDCYDVEKLQDYTTLI